jgi:transposase
MMMYTYSRGDRLMDFSFKLRCFVFEEWVRGGVKIKALCKKYGMSRKWFYKYKKRFERDGFAGLKDKARRFPVMPHALPLDKKLAIMDYIYDKPRHGAKNMSMNLAIKGIHISEGAIWNFLSREELNTRRKRKMWAHAQGKDVLTDKEKHCMEAKKNHVESGYPGELVSMDTFCVSIAGLGKIWQYTACDTYSSYGWAKLYRDKTADNSVDFFTNHMMRNCPDGKIKRVLTDQGVEFYCAQHKDIDGYFTVALKWCGVTHTVTKKAHPWTNGYAERLNQTIWQEFYLSRLSREFGSIEELQKELDAFMAEYNFKRMHMGYKLKAGGFRFPGHAFFDIHEKDKIIEIKY